MLLSTLTLATLLFTTIALGRLPHADPARLPQDVTMLVGPPDPVTLPEIALTPTRSETASLPQAPEAIAPDPPLPELANARAKPSRHEPTISGSARAESAPPEVPNTPAPKGSQQQLLLGSTAAPPPPPVPEAPERSIASVSNSDVAHRMNPNTTRMDPTREAEGSVPKRPPGSLGGVPLAQLLEEKDGLAAGLAALPSAERLSLPRVAIRVNAEWVEALPRTQERLYFSITAPRPDGEVLAYLSDAHSFDLERPEHPLWQIHDGERVPALAELRAEAGRWLGVSPELVGLYTWHPPVFEDALRMFVLERMQELRMRLGPLDVVTVRLTASSAGTVMNLEPIRQ